METEKTFQYGPAEQAAAQALLRSLGQAGYSTTRPRQAVIEAVATATGYLTPLQILARGRRSYARLGLVTVYRTLDILAGMGLVRKVHLKDGCHSYALAQQGHNHHIICRICRKVTDFEGCDISAVLESAARQTGFWVEEHWLELFGLCSQCRSAEPSGQAGAAVG